MTSDIWALPCSRFCNTTGREFLPSFSASGSRHRKLRTLGNSSPSRAQTLSCHFNIGYSFTLIAAMSFFFQFVAEIKVVLVLISEQCRNKDATSWHLTYRCNLGLRRQKGSLGRRDGFVYFPCLEITFSVSSDTEWDDAGSSMQAWCSGGRWFGHRRADLGRSWFKCQGIHTTRQKIKRNAERTVLAEHTRSGKVHGFHVHIQTYVLEGFVQPHQEEPVNHSRNT